jgi:hypothetical protein
VIVVLDTFVLIELERGGFLEAMCRLPLKFAVPDVLYHCELRGNVGNRLVSLGLRVEEISSGAVALALKHRRENPILSLPDSFALMLAKERHWKLLTGVRALADLALTEQVEFLGVLWLFDMMEGAGALCAQLLHERLEALAGRRHNSLPPQEISVRLERYRVAFKGQ